MNIVLLSGGSGKRLWPLSNDSRSKQFLKLLKKQNGEYESMVQRVYGQLNKAFSGANIVVATGSSQVDSIQNQLGDCVDIVVEPERRDTFPAILLSAAYLAFIKKVTEDEVVLVMPVDTYADMEYFRTLQLMEQAIQKNVADLVLMGIKPTYPSEKYGYILPVKEPKDHIYQVERFIEKPTVKTAEELLTNNAMWNGGVFAFKLGYLMNILKQYTEQNDFQELRNNYAIFKKISFDYEVVEKAKSIAMISYDGEWKDLGTWNTISEQMSDKAVGNVILGEDTISTTVINELNVPVVALGVKDMVIVASQDGILVSDKYHSSYIKPYVQNLGDRPMYEERRWGEYRIIDYMQYEDEIRSLTKHITFYEGKENSYHAHKMYDEIWTIIDGAADVVIDGHVRNVKRGDVAYIMAGQKHLLRAISDLHFIEVQIGKRLEEGDVEEFEWKW
jgi:Mannose-1-phosphate guanylyltransferase